MKNYRIKIVFKNGSHCEIDIASDEAGIKSMKHKFSNVYVSQKPDSFIIDGMIINIIETVCLIIRELEDK